MRQFRILILILLPLLSVTDSYAADLSLKLEQSFEHDIVFSRTFSDAIVDRDGELMVAFGIPGCGIVTSEKFELVAPAGQGPGDLSGYFALNLLDNQELVIEGYIGKTHIFKKQEGVYKWQRNEIRELKKYTPPTDTLFHENNWYLAAFSTYYDKKTDHYTVDYLQLYSDKGKFKKAMIRETFEEYWKIELFWCFLAEYKNRIFFLSEDKPLLRVISGDDPHVTKKVNLELPKFYKKMPDAFYRYPRGRMISSQDYWRYLSIWKTGYSRICNVLVDGRWLIVQVRTADEDNKLFGLLFYDAGTFELKHTIMTDDLLLANKDGKLYFFRGGNPTWDDVDDTVFDIYKIVEKK